MTNLKILSINLERNFFLSKKELLKEELKYNDYDIVLMQRGDLRLDSKSLGYKKIKQENSLITLYKDQFPGFTDENDLGFDIVSNLVIYYHNFPISIINVNCKNKESFFNVRSFGTVEKICEKYSNPNSKHYVRSRIVAGLFPKNVDIEEFCQKYALYDIFKKEFKNNINHFFISKAFECEDIKEKESSTEFILKKVI